MRRFFKHSRYGLAIADNLHSAREWLFETLTAEQERWFLFLPVFLACGIGVYFLLESEPSPLLCFALALAGAGAALAYPKSSPAFPFILALAFFLIGIGLAKLETERQRTPILTQFYDNVRIEGRITAIEPRLEPATSRWTIAPSAIEGLPEDALPHAVRLSVRPELQPHEFFTGEKISAVAVLYPMPSPAEPGGFDFARQGWFASLGGTGAITEAPILLAQGENLSWRERLTRWRNRMAAKLYEQTGGQSGAIAAALIFGTRGYIPESARTLLRDTGLAHILAISGLHMACFAGVLFFLTRFALALFAPDFTLRHPIKKWALLPALPGALVYLLISGGAIATQRAFLMFLIVALAILAGRPALTMRNVALAALAILFLSPSSLAGASFQMSFAATMAIIAAYETIPLPHGTRSRSAFMRLIRTLARAGLTLFLTSLAAWSVTSLLAAWHFNRIAMFTAMAANMLVLPIFTLLVMPAAAAVLALMPFGLEWLALTPMRAGLDVILSLAEFCATRFGRALPVAAPHALFALTATAGVIWFCLWQRNWRYAGLALALVAVLGAAVIPAKRPDILIDRNGFLTAMRDENGQLWFSYKPRNKFVAQNWLRRDGDSRSVEEAYDKSRFSCAGAICRANLENRPSLVILRSRRAKPEHCAGAEIVVSPHPRPPDFCPDATTFIDAESLRQGGAHALFFTAKGIEIKSAAQETGQRPWNSRWVNKGE